MKRQLMNLLAVTKEIQDALEAKKIDQYFTLFERRTELFSKLDHLKTATEEESQLIKEILEIDESNKSLVKELIKLNAQSQIQLIHTKQSLKTFDNAESFINVKA